MPIRVQVWGGLCVLISGSDMGQSLSLVPAISQGTMEQEKTLQYFLLCHFLTILSIHMEPLVSGLQGQES